MTKSNISIVNALKDKRYEIAEIYANSLYKSPRWVVTLDSAKKNWDEFLDEQFYAYVDYLARYFEFSDETFKNLYLGEKLKSLHAPDMDSQSRHLLAKNILEEELNKFEALLKSDLGKDWQNFVLQLENINKLITTQTKYQLNIVFLGDCLFLDILPFIVGPLKEEGISINAEYIASKNPLDVRTELKKLSSNKIDLIFYSPFTYDFSPNLAVLCDFKKAFSREVEIIKYLESSWIEAEKTIKVASDLFDCPIYVHNASLVIRDENSFKRFIKLKLTKRVRDFAKNWIDLKISDSLKKINKNTFVHLFLFDELKQFKNTSEFKAGSLLYSRKLQHPSVLGMLFAKKYTDIIYTHAMFRKKKIVVCDLDNTLWNGVIGEGTVEHFHERQAILKGLRNKGVVLAINSKNDPKNVHWRNATLSENDFVYEAINWQPKVHNMSKIPDELNLKINSFVFIDDRTDELELMKSAFPEVLCLNATDAKTWERLGIWEQTLEDDQEMDRTLMYQQREKRKEFVKEEVTTDEERLAMFSSLELKLNIKKPELSEIKRVTELVNRTNQFNLEGTRISLKDMTDWFNDKQYIILSGRTSDRFGDMGVTCVTVGQFVETEFRIIAFVLSCRVFGYHFEHCVMNHLKYLAKKRGAVSIKAKYVATAVNAPCKNFLKDNGFTDKDGYSYFDLSEDITADAPWIKVELN